MAVFKVSSRNNDRNSSIRVSETGVSESRKTIESSINPSSGNDSPISPAPVPNIKTVRENTPYSFLKLTPLNIQQGVIYSEIFGKPKALRRGR